VKAQASEELLVLVLVLVLPTSSDVPHAASTTPAATP
jgi:hypothetical protein